MIVLIDFNEDCRRWKPEGVFTKKNIKGGLPRFCDAIIVFVVVTGKILKINVS